MWVRVCGRLFLTCSQISAYFAKDATVPTHALTPLSLHLSSLFPSAISIPYVSFSFFFLSLALGFVNVVDKLIKTHWALDSQAEDPDVVILSLIYDGCK